MNIKKRLQELQKNVPQRAWHHTLKKLPEFWEATKDLPEDYTIAERAYFILNDLTLDDIKCKNCKQNLTRLCNKFENGFRDFCSTSCARNSTSSNDKQKTTCNVKRSVVIPEKTVSNKAKKESAPKVFHIYKDLPNFEALYNLCLNEAFPGSPKWPSEHPIWDCYVAKHISPRKAWSEPEMVYRAVKNLEYIWKKGIDEEKYEDYIDKWTQAIDQGGQEAARLVLSRFTIAKIAPKVTALAESAFRRILKEAGKDYSNGIYCPMAGFGGIVRAAKSLKVPVEAYDVNPNLNKWYGWIYRDVLAQTIETDKLVAACPPFGENTERWPGTPEEMYYSFEDWCKLIREHVKAPDYVFIGPEQKSKNKCGLFGKSLGVQLYENY